MSRRLDPRKLRLRAVWLLIIPFYLYASPSTILLAWGAGLSTVGLAIRAWAAGSIHKDRELATTGPYAHTRNPLYLGSFFLGSGVTVAGGQWVFGVAFLVFFLLVYRATVLREVSELEVRFGEGYPGLQGSGTVGAAQGHLLRGRVLRLGAGNLLPSSVHAEPRVGGGTRCGRGVRFTGLEA